MVRARVRGKRKAPIFKSKPKSENATDSATTEATANEPVKTDAEAPHLVSRTEENKEDNKGEEVKKGNVNKLRKRSRRKTERSSGTETVKDAVKPENLDRKKGSKKVESMGMIFMCNSKTKKDCYRYKVLGLPASKKDIVAKVYKGMRLFLFDIDLKLIYGIYKAAGPGGYNIEPKAFKSAFPSQVRFTVLDDFLPLAEEKFKKVVKDNYYGKNKFNCQLNSEQVKNLCKLFRLTSKSGNSKRVGRTSRQEAYKVAERGRSRWQSQDAVRHSPFGGNQLYQEGPNMYEREVFRSPEQGTRLRSQDGVRHSPLGGSLLYSEGPRRYQREAFPSSEQDRSMWRIQDGVRHTPLDGNSFYPEGLGMYEREAFPLAVLAPPPLRHPYVYEVPSDMNYYRRDTHLEHHGHGLYDFEHRLRKKTESQDAYSIYRQPPPYRDPLYSVAPPPEYRRVPSPPPPLLYRY